MSRYGPKYEYNWLNLGANFCPMNFFWEKDSKTDLVLICLTYYKFSKKSCLWWSIRSTYFKFEWVFFPKKDLARSVWTFSELLPTSAAICKQNLSLVLKILQNLIFVQKFCLQMTADVSKSSKSVQTDITFIFHALSETVNVFA